jgi:hypothetical protein
MNSPHRAVTSHSPKLQGTLPGIRTSMGTLRGASAALLTPFLICVVAAASWAQSDRGASGAPMTVAHAEGRTLAFPGAEGYGKYTRAAGAARCTK